MRCSSEFELRGDDTIQCELEEGHTGKHEAIVHWTTEDDR